MASYLALQQEVFSIGNYSIVPIRYEDRFNIMQWRNEQVYHLRQEKKLTVTDQENYFIQVIPELFLQEKPNQLLFSYLENEACIGYGGLVHINWKDKHAEISFIMDTKLEVLYFAKHWQTFLTLIEQVAFKQLQLHKIFTYAFNLRPHLYIILEQNFYTNEAVLEDHCFFEGNFIDVVIHSKINRHA